MWSISIDGAIILEHDPTKNVKGPGANTFLGSMMFQDEVEITPVGPTVKWPPKDEIQWFAVAFNFISRVMQDKNKISYQSPPGFDEWLRPGGPDAIY